MKQIRCKTRIFALLLIQLVLFNAVSMEVVAEDRLEAVELTDEDAKTVKIITIQSVDDLLDFANDCKLANYSEKREVYLKNDLDISEYTESGEFVGITSFSGMFFGENHTISGLNLSVGSESVGLFRYVENGAVIRDLNVYGNLSSADGKNNLGGIAGINAGTIRNCVFNGAVNGVGVTGGIVGLNGNTGSIINCINKGLVNSAHTVGGIAGDNRGIITDCINKAGVNSGTEWMEIDTESGTQISVSSMFSLLDEAIEDGADFGGIAGYSNGIIAGCINAANVGYPHSGKNVGGIAGRQCGQIISCKNDGKIYGKQDVGGIVGQFEPYLVYEEIDELDAKVDELHDMMNNMIGHMEDMGDDLHQDFMDINEESSAAGDTADALVDEMRDVVNKNVEVINELSKRIDYAMNHLGVIATYINSGLDVVDLITEDLGKFCMDETDFEVSVNKDAVNRAKDQLNNQSDQLVEDINNITVRSDAIRDILTDEQGNARTPENLSKDEIQELSNLLLELMGYVSDAGTASSEMLGNVNVLINEAEPYAENTRESVNEGLEKISTDIREMNDAMKSAGTELQGVLEYLNSLSALKATGFSENFDRNSHELKGQLDNINELLNRLDSHSYGHSEILERDMRAINDKMNEIFNILVNKIDHIEGLVNGEDFIVDKSKEDKDLVNTAHISLCTNNSVVSGDRNVAGIAGVMDREALDRENNTKFKAGGRIIARAVLSGCSNNGFITVKNERGGGIVGDLEIGYLTECIGSGRVQSKEGNYIGGIAGISCGVIDFCSSNAVLRGADYVGGIAGQAEYIKNCYSMVCIPKADGWIGAIAGQDREDTKHQDDITITRNNMRDRIEENYYVSSRLFGINGVSYAGIAEPISYQELLVKEDIPDIFSKLTVTFLDSMENVVQTSVYPYGYNLLNLEYPELVTDSEEYMEWEGFDGDTLESNIVIQAVETSVVTVLSGEKNDSLKAKVLAAGSFTEAASIHIEEYTGRLPEGLSKYALCSAYYVSLEGTMLGENEVTKIRLMSDAEGKTVVYRLDGNNWNGIDSKRLGSYEEVDMIGTQGVFCLVTTKPRINWLIVGLVAVGVTLVIVSIVLIISNKKK